MSTHRWIIGVQALVGLLTLAAALWWWEPPAIPVPWERWQPSGASVGFRIQERKPTVPAQGSVVTLAFAFTSDLHGHLSSTRLLPERKPSGLAHLVPVLRQLRTEHPGLVLLDAGDTIQGDPASFYFSHIRPDSGLPLPIIHAMNQLGYHAVVLGNHDFEPPVSVLQQTIAASKFLWLSGNAWLDGEDRLLLPPYLVLERQGVRVGIVGFTTPGVPLWIDPERIAGLAFADLVDSAQKWSKILRERENVDLLIGVFHSGDDLRYDQQIAQLRKLPLPNTAGLVADHVIDYDLIVSGHAHKLRPRKPTSRLTRFRTPLLSPGSGGEGVSVARFTLEARAERWQLRDSHFEFHKAARQPDAPLLTELEPQLAEVERYLAEPTRVVLKKRPTRKQLNACGSALQHKATVHAFGAEAITLLPGSWFLPDLPEVDLGQPVTRKHLFGWVPYDNTLVEVALFGRQIARLLETHRRRLLGRRVRYSGWLVPGGIAAVLEGDWLRVQQKNGSSLADTDSLRAWLTNYHANGGSGLQARALIHDEQIQRRTGVFLRELVFAWLQEPPEALPEACQSWLAEAVVPT